MREAMPVLLDEGGHQAAAEDLRAELRHSGTVERHGATPDEGRRDLPAGGGSSDLADSLVGPQCLTGCTVREGPTSACVVGDRGPESVKRAAWGCGQTRPANRR